jgi:hypothetical protein
MERHYYRCSDCLGVWAVDGPQIKEICCDCDGIWLHMGMVVEERLKEEKTKSACDARCTHASGPKCNCFCCGKNHGSGKVVLIWVDKGGIPRAQGLLDRIKERREIADKWREALSLAEKIQSRQTDYYLKNRMATAIALAKKAKTTEKRFSVILNAITGM